MSKTAWKSVVGSRWRYFPESRRGHMGMEWIIRLSDSFPKSPCVFLSVAPGWSNQPRRVWPLPDVQISSFAVRNRKMLSQILWHLSQGFQRRGCALLSLFLAISGHGAVSFSPECSAPIRRLHLLKKPKSICISDLKGKRMENSPDSAHPETSTSPNWNPAGYANLFIF